MTGLFQRMRVTRIMRLQEYLGQLRKEVPVTGKFDQRRVAILDKKITKVLIKMRVLTWIRIFFYGLLYISVISNFLGDIADPGAKELQSFTKPLVVLSSILGTTLSLLVILLLTKVINTYWEDCRTYATHMIAIYAKNEKPSSMRIESFFELENGN
jgi:hypothetical protein